MRKTLLFSIFLLFFAGALWAERAFRLEFSNELLLTDNLLVSGMGEDPVDDIFLRLKESVSWVYRRKALSAEPFLLLEHRRHGRTERADCDELHAGSKFMFGKSHIKVTGYLTGNHLSSGTYHGDPVVYHESGLKFRYRYHFPSGWRAVFKYRYSEGEYVPEHRSRDSIESEYILGLGYYLLRPVYMEGGVIKGAERGRGGNYSNDEEGLYFNFNGDLETISYSLMYEYKEREYLTGALGDGNFERRDIRREYSVGLYFPLRENMKLTLTGNYIENGSSRADRSFHQTVFALGLFYAY